MWKTIVVAKRYEIILKIQKVASLKDGTFILSKFTKQKLKPLFKLFVLLLRRQLSEVTVVLYDLHDEIHQRTFSISRTIKPYLIYTKYRRTGIHFSPSQMSRPKKEVNRVNYKYSYILVKWDRQEIEKNWSHLAEFFLCVNFVRKEGKPIKMFHPLPLTKVQLLQRIKMRIKNKQKYKISWLQPDHSFRRLIKKESTKNIIDKFWIIHKSSCHTRNEITF